MARFRLKILIDFVLTLLIFFVLSVYTYYSRIQQETTEWVIHTIEGRYLPRLLLGDLLNAGTSQCDFLITGDPACLKLYQKSPESIHEDIRTFKALARDNVWPQGNVKKIVPMIAERKYNRCHIGNALAGNKLLLGYA